MCQKDCHNRLNVNNLKKAMINYNIIYSDNAQHDSTIFFNDLLNALNIELKGNYDDEDDDISNEESFLEKYEKCMSKSKVNEIFSFFIKDMTVFDCGEKMIDYTEYFYLDLPIFDENNRKISKIYDALDIYTKKSYDKGKNALICCKDKIKENSYNQNLFASLPEILVISLKRVVNGQHIDHYLEYGLNLNMRKYVQNYDKSTNYELFAEILHFGSAMEGHKIAICKNFNTNNWYSFNDERVTEEKNIISSNAFLLFYKRK